MPTYLLDTEHLSLYAAGHPMVRFRVDAQPPGEVCTCPTTAEEAVRGRLAMIARFRFGLNLINAYRWFVDSLNILRQFPIISYESVSDAHFQRLDTMRLRIGTLDVRIGAVALAHGLTVLTRNKRDFGKIPGLRFADWSV